MKSDFLDQKIAKLDSTFDGNCLIGFYQLLFKQGKTELMYAIDMSDHGKDNKVLVNQGRGVQLLNNSIIVFDSCIRKVKLIFDGIDSLDAVCLCDTLQVLNKRYNLAKKDNSW